MAGTDASAYLSAVKWGDEAYYLREFVQKMEIPQVAKIIKGQYLNLGVPSLSSPSLNQIVFLSSGGKRIKVAAQCVKFKEGRRVVPVGPKLAIPDNYQGWFEILSEDGRAVRCIESVAELARRYPETCVVRDPIKVLISKTEDPDSVAEKNRTLQPGETLVLVGEISASVIKGKNSSGRYLRCFTSKNETVYLNMEQKGRFSPVAGEENISGVHTIRNLLTKRLPMMVRMVNGKPPIGHKSSSQFLPEMRLYSLFEEDCVVALPLLKDSHIVPLPMSAPLKLLTPKNAESLIKLREYVRLKEKCHGMIQGVSDQIQVFDITMSKELRNDFKNNNCPLPVVSARRFSQVHRPIARRLPHIHLIQRSLSDPQGTGGIASVKVGALPMDSTPILKKQSITCSSIRPAIEDSSVREAPEDNRYDEIDQIYDYVRGFAPLPIKIKSDYIEDTSIVTSAAAAAASNSKSSETIQDVVSSVSPRISPVAGPQVPSSNSTPSTPTVDKSTISSPAPSSPSAIATSHLSNSIVKPAQEVVEKKPEPPPIETIPIRKVSTVEPVPIVIIPKMTPTPSISSKNTPTRKKEVNKERKTSEDHIYEKLNKRKEDISNNNNNNANGNANANSSKLPIRSNSAGKMFPYQLSSTIPGTTIVTGATTNSSNSNNTPSNNLNHNTCNGNNKMFVKSNSQQRSTHKSRFFKHFKSSSQPAREPAMVHQLHTQQHYHQHHHSVNGTQKTPHVKSYRNGSGNKSLSTSPLFNIRYKSLTNLVLDFNTLDSSNSGGQTTSSGSAGSKEHRPREPKVQKRSRLPRPRSLTNLLWDISQVDSRNRYNLMQSEVPGKGDSRKFIFAPVGCVDTKFSAGQGQRLGTLYL